MKAIIRPKNYWFLFNIPIFGTALLLIFFANAEILHSLSYTLFILAGLVVIFNILPNKSFIPVVAPLKLIQCIFTALLIPGCYLLLLTVIVKTLLFIHPGYSIFTYPLMYYFHYFIAIGSLLTLLLGNILHYFYYYTDADGCLSDAIHACFHPPAEFVATLNIFTGLAIQVLMISCLSFVVLMCLRILGGLLHIKMQTGFSILLLFVYYIFIMLPKIPYYERFVSSLLQKNWRIGYIYLLSCVFAIVAWLVIQFGLMFLPTSWLPGIFLLKQYQFTPLGAAALSCTNQGALCDVKLVELSLLPSFNAWVIAFYSFSLLCSPLFASYFVRRGYFYDKRMTWIGLGIVLILLPYFPYSFLPQLKEPAVLLLIGIFIVGIVLICSKLQGNQINQIGFLPNKNQLKNRRPIKAIIPSLQGLHILIALYYLIGIYTYTFALYLAALPFAVIIAVTLIVFILLRLRRSF